MPNIVFSHRCFLALRSKSKVWVKEKGQGQGQRSGQVMGQGQRSGSYFFILGQIV